MGGILQIRVHRNPILRPFQPHARILRIFVVFPGAPTGSPGPGRSDRMIYPDYQPDIRPCHSSVHFQVGCRANPWFQKTGYFLTVLVRNLLRIDSKNFGLTPLCSCIKQEYKRRQQRFACRGPVERVQAFSVAAPETESRKREFRSQPQNAPDHLHEPCRITPSRRFGRGFSARGRPETPLP
ncbi:hypothetical protein DSECCO2_318100 [anaerobic digester metagenome]|jgi:hypothetical protein